MIIFILKIWNFMIKFCGMEMKDYHLIHPQLFTPLPPLTVAGAGLFHVPHVLGGLAQTDARYLHLIHAPAAN